MDAWHGRSCCWRCSVGSQCFWSWRCSQSGNCRKGKKNLQTLNRRSGEKARIFPHCWQRNRSDESIAASKIPACSGAWRQAGQGAAIGAASGAMEPVTDADNFWGNKAKQTAAGAIGGGIATPVLSKLGGAVTRRAIPAEQGITGQAATQKQLGMYKPRCERWGRTLTTFRRSN